MTRASTARAASTVKLENVYRAYMGKRSGQPVWIVDWDAVCRLYPDWIMGGNDQRYRFNPPDEIWIDGSMGIEEYEYTVIHELVEQRLMRDLLWTYDRAHDHANITEDRKLRASNARRAVRKAAKLQRDGAPQGYEPQQYQGVYKAFNGIRMGHEVWVVDGPLVRKELDADFAFPGAHSFRRNYVPEGEIWLDSATSCATLPLAMVELLTSLKAIKAGRPKEEAYDLANEARELERARQRLLCAEHELVLPPVKQGARERGVRVAKNH